MFRRQKAALQTAWPAQPAIVFLVSVRGQAKIFPRFSPEKEFRAGKKIGRRFGSPQSHQTGNAFRSWRVRSQNRWQGHAPPRHENVLPGPALIALKLAKRRCESFRVARQHRPSEVCVELP